MLEFLHKDRTYKIEPIHREGNRLTFITEETIPTEKTVKVCDAEDNAARLIVWNLRRTDFGLWLCFSTLEEGTLEPTTEWPGALREEPRLEVSLRVRSEHFPGFSALTHDLSVQGVQVLTDQPLNVGEVLDVTLDLDDEREPLEMNAAVRWSKLSPPCRSGLLFLEISPEKKRRVQEFLAFRSQPDLVVPRLSESLKELNTEGTSIETQAQVLDGFRDEHFVTLRLGTQRELLDFSFPTPRVMVSELDGSNIRLITSRPSAPGTFVFEFHDDEERLVLQLESTPPEITVSQRLP